jgi:hypothetical protein
METLNELFKALPDIIKNASQSRLGILALLAIIVGCLAWGFFREAPVKVRLATWSLILVGTISFFIATTDASRGTKSSPAIQATTNALSIAGTTVDAASNETVRQAQISLVGRPETAVSDNSGNFRLELSGRVGAQADVRLKVSKVGYDPYESQVTAPHDAYVIPLHPAK